MGLYLPHVTRDVACAHGVWSRASMLTLHLFGGMSLTDEVGPTTGRAAQRRRLAILAILAVARGKPVSRDRLVALLWPEAGADQARHLLADSLYVIRGELGEQVIRATGNDLALDCSHVASDVVAFADALDAGDRQRAVRIYASGGPFLDGVHLSDGAEFERWVDSVRSRFSEEYRRALGQLAAAATAAGDRHAAVEWWRQLAADDRLSSRVALGMMRALVAAGDRAGALEFARAHAALVRAELEAEPDDAVTALEAELRAPQAPVPPARALNDAPAQATLSPPAALATPVAPAAPGPTPQPRRRRTVLAAMCIVALVVVAYGAVATRGAHSVTSMLGARTEPSIAVLPFANNGTDPTDDRFLDGMTEELIAAVAAAGRLRVIGSSSAFVFKGHHADVRAIAESLHVANVLEGGVQRSGQQVRVSVRLIDASSGVTRWSHVFERRVNDMFAVEDEIARAVASSLNVQVVDRMQRRSPTAEAFDLFLRGSDQQLLRSDSAARIAVDYFGRAVAADATFSAAYAGLARSYSVVCQGREPQSRRLVACDSATIAARHAIALDSTLADGYAELSYARSMVLDLSGSRAAAERALALDPNHAEAHEFLEKALEWSGRQDEGLIEARRALALDPLSVSAIAEMGRALFYARRDDDALATLAPLRSLRPPVRRVKVIVGRIYEQKKMWREAMTEFDSPALGSGPDRSYRTGRVLAESGHRAEAEAILANLKTGWSGGKVRAWEVATVYVGLHDFDNAFVWIDKAIDDLSLGVDIMDPTFAELRTDPRFARVRERLGLASR